MSGSHNKSFDISGTSRDVPGAFDVPGLTADEIQARVLHRDGLMLVIDKPAGLPVHRGPKGGPNLEASFDGLRFGLPRPPVLAHRLDKDTTGCLVLGRHRKATASLGLLFKHGKVEKTYWTVVEGGPIDVGTVPVLVPTGIAIAAPEGYDVQVRPRSGLSSRGILAILGTLDADYRGEVFVTLYRLPDAPPHTISDGDRIAQLVVARHVDVEWTEVKSLDSTERGDRGHGSTGR